MEPNKLEEYRKLLNSLEEKAQASYDKTVLTLSGGALGLSITFIDKILRGKIATAKNILIAAWSSWGLSLAIVLFSFLFSQFALRKAINQVDNETIYKETPGGCFDVVTKILNILSGSLFLLGVALLIIFIYKNMGG